jgi:hypothetical protein
MPLRSFITLLIVGFALPVAAGDGFPLGLAEMDFSTPAPPPDVLPGLAADDVPAERAEVLALTAALRPLDAAERTTALWDSDLGRVYLALAAEQSMLGREGLVNGGRMAGVGLATAGLGDGDPNGAFGAVIGRHRWVEMNANQKIQATVEVSILAALLYFMAANAD